MRFALLFSLLAASACSSNQVQDQIPPFQADKVCSAKSLAYVKIKTSQPAPKMSEAKIEDIHQRMLSLEPTIRRCYEEEMDRTNKPHTFNLCFVTGYNKKGVMDFFEFSSKEVELSPEFFNCLAVLKKASELKGLKNVSITQPYRMHPRR